MNRAKAMKLSLVPEDNRRLMSLCGELDAHLQSIERNLSVSIHNRGHDFTITGDNDTLVEAAGTLLTQLYAQTESNLDMDEQTVHVACKAYTDENTPSQSDSRQMIRTRKAQVKPKTRNQAAYLEAIASHDINFGIGPAGTGKTFLAVAQAVHYLEKAQVERLVLVRPAVEAGENLGFLPGDLAQKIDPYLRPLYDALYALMGFETVAKLIERQVIEIAPLAYMRGRTLDNAFIILDEGQNTTIEQMKMFLTRVGFGSKVVVTGDVTQIDLPRGKGSGLRHAESVLRNIEGIHFTHFRSSDVVRHPLVQAIIEAYSDSEAKDDSDG